MDWQLQLISLYVFICKQFEEGLANYCARMSNYADLSFTDEEIVTIFLCGIIHKHKELKDIYRHAYNYWREWFPRLSSYVAFIQRLNKLNGVFVPLIRIFQPEFV